MKSEEPDKEWTTAALCSIPFRVSFSLRDYKRGNEFSHTDKYEQMKEDIETAIAARIQGIVEDITERALQEYIPWEQKGFNVEFGTGNGW